MPPPPPGMRVLEPAKKLELLQAAAPGAADATDANAAVKEDSAELEQLRALEEAELAPAVHPDAKLRAALRGLGLANPLRQRMMEALDAPGLRDDGSFPELQRIHDVARFDISQIRERYDIPVEMQPLVVRYIEFFQGKGRKWFARWMARSSRFIPVMQPILEAAGVPRDLVYLAMIESGFSATAYSWAHAAGPWQFIASTGKQYGLEQDFWVDERRDPIKATHAAAKYLKDLYRQFGHWYLAWAGYNTGGGRVRRMIRQQGTEDFWKLSEGRGFAQETQHYVPKLIAAALVAKHPRAFGFSESEFDYEDALTFDEVRLTDATDLEVIAKAAGVTVPVLQELNPELKRWCTPPATVKAPYVLRLPLHTAPKFAEAFAKVPARERLTFRIHTVKRGDTLSRIAGLYGSATDAILQMNRLRNARALKVGSDLVIPVPERGARARTAHALVSTRRPAPTSPRPRRTGGHSLAAGETLWGVAKRYAISVDDLKRWNQIDDARALRPGRVLVVTKP